MTKKQKWYLMDFCLSSCMRSCSMRSASSLVSGVCVCVCVCVHIHIYVHAYTRRQLHMYTHTYTYMHTYMQACCKRSASRRKLPRRKSAQEAGSPHRHAIEQAEDGLLQAVLPLGVGCEHSHLQGPWSFIQIRTSTPRACTSQGTCKLAAAALRTCTPRQQQRTCDRRRSISSSARINLSLVAASRASHSSLKSMISI